MSRSPKLATIADRFDALLVNPLYRGELSTLAMTCLADVKLSNVDELQLPRPWDIEVERPPLTLGQMTLALSALHAVYCDSVEGVVDLPELTVSDDYSTRKAEFSMGQRWYVICGKIDQVLPDDAPKWFKRLLRRVEKHLADFSVVTASKPRTLGRRPKYDISKDRGFVQRWQTLNQDEGVLFKDFCKKENASVKDGKKILNRVRKNRPVKKKQ